MQKVIVVQYEEDTKKEAKKEEPVADVIPPI